MKVILFWVFTCTFVITIILAVVTVVMLIFSEGWENPTRAKWAYILWSAVLVEVSVGIFALFNNLFDLSNQGEVSTLSNNLSEMIESLEANEYVTEAQANELREVYADRLGVSGTVITS